MPSASPMYTFSSEFTEAATASMLHQDTRTKFQQTGSEDLPALTLQVLSEGDSNNNNRNIDGISNNNSCSNNSSPMHCNSGGGRVDGGGCAVDSNTIPYNPFKCLSAMAEQTFESPHSLTTLKCCSASPPVLLNNGTLNSSIRQGSNVVAVDNKGNNSNNNNPQRVRRGGGGGERGGRGGESGGGRRIGVNTPITTNTNASSSLSSSLHAHHNSHRQYDQQQQPHLLQQYQPCDATNNAKRLSFFSSSSPSPSLLSSPGSSSSSPSLSPSSSSASCCLYAPDTNQQAPSGCYSDFLNTDHPSEYYSKTQQHPNETSRVNEFASAVNNSESPFSPCASPCSGSNNNSNNNNNNSYNNDSHKNNNENTNNNSSNSHFFDKSPVEEDMKVVGSKKDFSLCAVSDQALEDDENLLSWTRRHPEGWTSSEVLDWLFYVAQEHCQDMQELRGENFQGITGSQLCQMGLEDFTKLEPKFGAVLFEVFKKLLCDAVFRKPIDMGDPLSSPCPQFSPHSPMLCHSPRHQTPSQHSTTLQQNQHQQQHQSYHFHHQHHHHHQQQQHHGRPPPPMYGMPCVSSGMDSGNGVSGTEMFFKEEQGTTMLSNGNIDITSYDFDLDDSPCIPNGHCPEQYQNDYGMYPVQYPQSMPIHHATSGFHPPSYPAQLPRRRPGRPRVKGILEEGRTAKEKKVKSQHLWEFIYETLMNPLYNPQYLRWENQRDGVFRFMQSEAVAQLWGSRKNNENMTYEKLSRAMRHYYKRGILERVEGRRLVYKFSLKAMDKVREKRSNSSS
ncbi:probable serine/threonine-protein kinase DDB_G0282963 [Aplysia californica]|uniref:Probable serine/threonine-protein kinase DDB_G0282963 n=1 Tax=Aplysia californica TaxID=6500 RepID=A0ABM1VS71_APLCA|nr:probable serine/threonine-protein kinase DDB_G0282963 [Aplysia californica]